MLIDFDDKEVDDEAFTTLERCLSLVKKRTVLGRGVDIYGEIPMNQSFLRKIASVLKGSVIYFRGYHKGTQFWMNLCSAEQEIYLRLVSDREERITLPPNAQVYFGAEIKAQISFERTQKLILGLRGYPLPLSFKRELMPDIKKLSISDIHPGDLRHLVPFYDVLQADINVWLPWQPTRKDDVFVSWRSQIRRRKDLVAMAAFYEKLDTRFLDLSLKDMRGAHLFVTRCSSLHRDILRLFLTF